MRRICGAKNLLLMSGLFAFLLCALISARAQGNATGSIQGTVTDSSGAVVSGAKVIVTNTATNKIDTLTTRDDGGYNVFNLPVGIYNIKVDREGFNTEVRQGVQVGVGQGAVINVELRPG